MNTHCKTCANTCCGKLFEPKPEHFEPPCYKEAARVPTLDEWLERRAPRGASTAVVDEIKLDYLRRLMFVEFWRGV